VTNGKTETTAAQHFLLSIKNSELQHDSICGFSLLPRKRCDAMRPNMNSINLASGYRMNATNAFSAASSN
jgi:hypothetical protein